MEPSHQHYTDILANLGIEQLNPMQEAAFDAISGPQDTFLISPTGSGKTLAFLLPLLNLLQPGQTSVQCLVLVPSRELALQIEQVWRKMSTGFKINVCYGGHPIQTEIQNLSEPPALLIGTPGRIADHLDRRSVDLSAVHTLVLDEFDKSLELGFHDQMTFILDHLPAQRKQVLVSATAGVKIPGFVELNNPKRLKFTAEELAPALTLKQITVASDERMPVLVRLLCTFGTDMSIIFCNLRDTTEQVSNYLNDEGLSATFYHGGMEQEDRERALIRFRNGSVRVLVTTDLAARGLDIPEMKHVVHVDLPLHKHEFVHRNGRTARMQATGTAYVLLPEAAERPLYLTDDIEEAVLPEHIALPPAPEFTTVYISGGRKNKLSKIDIVGFFSQKGGLEKADLGLIDVKDFMTFAAVRKSKVPDLLHRVRDEKMKGKKYKIAVAR
nr:DEAD/DEAH box helicase [uncultured Arsenicibacter sp.]